jgi:hypothetical protein
MLDLPVTQQPKRSLPLLAQRPLRRSDCVDGPRPCPWVGCRYHLQLDLVAKHKTEEVVENPSFEWGQESCALDVAERGTLTSKEIAPLIGLSQSGCKELYRDSKDYAEEVAKILANGDSE